MSRSKYKGPFIDINLLNDVKRSSKAIQTFSRKCCIIPFLLNKTLHVYNGKRFLKLKITEDMIGCKLGEFSFTKKEFSFKKKKRGSKN